MRSWAVVAGEAQRYVVGSASYDLADVCQTKAKKAVSKKSKSKKHRGAKAEGSGGESDLTDLEAED